MKIIRYPKKGEWAEILSRPATDQKEIEDKVLRIVDSVRRGGDDALRSYTKAFDKTLITEFAVTDDEFAIARDAVPDDLKAAIDIAMANIARFHQPLVDNGQKIETSPGVLCWRRAVPIERVGLYIPGGSAPLLSTVLMLGIPAKLAGCREIVLCSPPDDTGNIASVILYSAQKCGINKVFKVGGAQAIAALAYGTASVPAVYKIFGPGNRYVTAAKQMVSMDVAIDMPAGPSEVAILADGSCAPAFIAADLLSQAEHGPDSHMLLVTMSETVIERTVLEIKRQIADLPRREIAEASLANSKMILVEDLETGIEMVNEYAPEHLILAVTESDAVADKISNAGSVFLGNYSCESAGDYASGTNHTLPTGGSAKALSGLSVDSFMKTITFQRLTRQGIRELGPAIECMAAAEGLDAHRRAVSLRLEEVNGV